MMEPNLVPDSGLKRLALHDSTGVPPPRSSSTHSASKRKQILTPLERKEEEEEQDLNEILAPPPAKMTPKRGGEEEVVEGHEKPKTLKPLPDLVALSSSMNDVGAASEDEDADVDVLTVDPTGIKENEEPNREKEVEMEEKMMSVQEEEEQEVMFLHFAYQPIKGFPGCLFPCAPTTHENAGSLSAMAHKGALHAGRVTELALSELARFAASQKMLAERMEVSVNSMSMALKERAGIESWETHAPMTRRILFWLFQWLCMSLRDRVAVFYPVLAHDDDLANPVHTLPQIGQLREMFKRECDTNGIGVKQISPGILAVPVQAAYELTHSTLPWDLIPTRRLAQYGHIYQWLRMNEEDRLVLYMERKRKTTKATVVKEPSLPRIDLVCSDAAAFLDKHGLSSRDLVERVLKCPDEDVAAAVMILDKPVPWEEADAAAQFVYVQVAKWLSIKGDEKRLSKFTKRRKSSIDVRSREEVVSPPLTDSVLAPPPTTEAEASSSEELYLNLQPAAISALMLDEFKADRITKKKFSSVLGVNRNYVDSLFKMPGTWLTVTPLQREVFKAARSWLGMTSSQRNAFIKQTDILKEFKPAAAAPPPPATPPSTSINTPNNNTSSSGGPKLPRASFTPEMRAYMGEVYKLNTKPSRETRQQIADKFGMDIQKITNHFSNRRQRDEAARNEAREAHC